MSARYNKLIKTSKRSLLEVLLYIIKTEQHLPLISSVADLITSSRVNGLLFCPGNGFLAICSIKSALSAEKERNTGMLS